MQRGDGSNPRAIMLMIGSNNAGRMMAAESGKGFETVVFELQNRIGRREIAARFVLASAGH